MARIAGERRWARVIAPRILEEGAEGAIEVRLSKAALAELGGGTATGRLAVSVRSRTGALRRVVAVRIEQGGEYSSRNNLDFSGDRQALQAERPTSTGSGQR